MFRAREPNSLFEQSQPAFDAKAACSEVYHGRCLATIEHSCRHLADTMFTEHSCATARDSHAIPSWCPPQEIDNHDKQFMSKYLNQFSVSFARCKDTPNPPFHKIKFSTFTC